MYVKQNRIDFKGVLCALYIDTKQERTSLETPMKRMFDKAGQSSHGHCKIIQLLTLIVSEHP